MTFLFGVGSGSIVGVCLGVNLAAPVSTLALTILGLNLCFGVEDTSFWGDPLVLLLTDVI